MRIPITPITVAAPHGHLQVHLAASFAMRARGLLFTPALATGAALLILPCRSIHTIGMRHAIDALFLDDRATIIAVHDQLVPWRVAVHRGARAVLELSAGMAAEAGLHVGRCLPELAGIVGRR